MPKKKGGNEILLARGRLKGVLQDLVTPSDSEMMDEYENPSCVPVRGRPPKRTKTTEEPANTVHESFVMKLFDRSLDLAKYRENTPLYPVCRAWMANSPRSKSNESHFDEIPSPTDAVSPEHNYDFYEKLLNGKIKKITSMPPPKPSDIPRTPTIIVPEIKEEHFDEQLTKDELLMEHKRNWKKVRKDWVDHIKRYQERFEMNFELLNAIKET